MASYKDPTFQECTALAQAARAKALQKLAAKPALDAATIALRKAAQAARDQAQAEKSAARKAAIAEAKEAKRAARKAAIAEAKEAKRAAAQAPVKPGLSEAEQKAARDERYAARKKRKG